MTVAALHAVARIDVIWPPAFPAYGPTRNGNGSLPSAAILRWTPSMGIPGAS